MVVLKNGRVEEFESETAIKEQLKGNIYLAKITRVEPSLQAAFVDYGGGRHGFLPFSEIHPDYYNIPVADKQELLASLRNIQENDEDDADKSDDNEIVSERKSNGHNKSAPLDGTSERSDISEIQYAVSDVGHAIGEKSEHFSDSDSIGSEVQETRNNDRSDIDESAVVDVIDNSADEELSANSRIAEVNLYRRYKIQEVMKRNQIILVQVEKEERGNKGASLTTFISLAGRYCVLMPNALRRGGVSRRIGSYEDRKRLKQIIRQLKIPEETGLIVRTAGATKSAEQIQRDYDYLVNLWNHIRQETLQSTAPAFIHAEGDIVKRILRDWYNEDVDELLIEGDDAYRHAREFIKEIMPDQTGRIKQYRNKVPIFGRYRVEEQITGLFSQQVPLESGGSLVVMPTEALISIDVNSGKLTNTRNIEDTATSTNLEAAREIARQLRLRNLSGLIVIDFIDMMELKNKKAIERELKMAFVGDRAKIQIGRISAFGLLEMSRQRLSPSFLEVNSIPCQSCKGGGFLKAPGSTAANVLRAVEHEISRGGACTELKVSVPAEVAVYILNHKRNRITDLEKNYQVRIMVHPDTKVGLDGFLVERTRGGEVISREEASQIPEAAVINEANDNGDQRGKYKRRRKLANGDANPMNEEEYVANSEADGQPNRPIKMVAHKQTKVGMFEGLWRKIVD